MEESPGVYDGREYDRDILAMWSPLCPHCSQSMVSAIIPSTQTVYCKCDKCHISAEFPYRVWRKPSLACFGLVDGYLANRGAVLESIKGGKWANFTIGFDRVGASTSQP